MVKSINSIDMTNAMVSVWCKNGDAYTRKDIVSDVAPDVVGIWLDDSVVIIPMHQITAIMYHPEKKD